MFNFNILYNSSINNANKIEKSATILGCAKKLSKVMKLKIATMPDYNDDLAYVNDFYVINRVSKSIKKTVNSSINNAITKSHISETTSSSSGSFRGGSSSSSGGFGGGSSFGGGGGGRRRRRRTLLIYNFK